LNGCTQVGASGLSQHRIGAARSEYAATID
jgi:hypothetical protein